MNVSKHQKYVVQTLVVKTQMGVTTVPARLDLLSQIAVNQSAPVTHAMVSM